MISYFFTYTSTLLQRTSDRDLILKTKNINYLHVMSNFKICGKCQTAGKKKYRYSKSSQYKHINNCKHGGKKEGNWLILDSQNMNLSMFVDFKFFIEYSETNRIVVLNNLFLYFF